MVASSNNKTFLKKNSKKIFEDYKIDSNNGRIIYDFKITYLR